jgi:hypothetical protein
MFFKTQEEKLKEKYNGLLKEAMNLQRSGKIPEYAKKSAQAQDVYKEIEALSN